MYERWKSDHMPNDSLPSKTRSSSALINPSQISLSNQRYTLAGSLNETPSVQGLVWFNMAFVPPQICRALSTSFTEHNFDKDSICSPPLDDGTHYSAIDPTKICLLSSQILPSWLDELDLVRDEFDACHKWQFGIDEH